MAWGVYIGDTNLADLGVYVMRAEGAFNGLQRSFAQLAIPGRSGVVLASDPTIGPRTIRLECVVTPAARTIAARQQAEDALLAVAYRGLVRLVVDDDVTSPRAIDGVCTAVDIAMRQHPVDATVSNATITVECPDPTWYDVAASVVRFGTTLTPIPIGTAPTGGILRVGPPVWSANCTDVVITYASGAGVQVGYMTFVFTLTAGLDYVEVDLDRQTATKYASGVASNALPYLTAGDFFTLDPLDGDQRFALYPRLSCTASGAATPSGQWLGLKRWI